MKKRELEKKMKKLKEQDKKVEYERELRENVLCSACLEQQSIQRKIDEKTHNERLLESMIIELVCEYFQHTSMDQDRDDTFCVLCGVLQSPSIL